MNDTRPSGNVSIYNHPGLSGTIPLYNHYGFPVGQISLKEAVSLHGTDLDLRAKGTGRRRRFTSAKLYALTSIKWTPKPSAGFLVLQLVTQ